jgi:hypothetical protein
MAILLRWLHPDRDRYAERDAFAVRVTRAWNNLKTPEQRAAYDLLRRQSRRDKDVPQPMGRSRPKGFNSEERKKALKRDGRATGRPQTLHSAPGRRGPLSRILLYLFGRAAI